MDKTKQKNLSKWLKQQSKLAKKWLLISILLGVLSSLFLLAQAALLASILHQLIIEHTHKSELVLYFIGLVFTIAGRAGCSWGREVAGFRTGEQVRVYIRQLILDKISSVGPAYIKGKPAGVWATLLLEQVEDMQEFFSRYLPQLSLSVFIPLVILVVVFPMNWAVGLIFLLTAPFVPFFMALVGMKAAEANRKNFKALQRLSGHFYDRLQSMTTIRLFNRANAEEQNLHGASEIFRNRTMDVLKVAFLSSAVLEFFVSISIAITAIYFGFSYIGEFDFGHYGTKITLFTGLFILILAPEFYQPLRDLGTFYHAKAQAIGAAESIVEFLQSDVIQQASGEQQIPCLDNIQVDAKDLIVTSSEGEKLLGPISFTLLPNQVTALVGPSGSGKTTLINAILGFLPYTGSLKVNGVEIHECHLEQWRNQISWVGQNPLLLHGTIKDNITLGNSDVSEQQIESILEQSFSAEFVHQHGLDYLISDRSGGLSVGQAQRLALARAMLKKGNFWLLDEPTASLDSHSEKLVMEAIQNKIKGKTTLLVAHQLSQLKHVEHILVMQSGTIVEVGSYCDLQKNHGLFSTMLKTGNKLGDINTLDSESSHFLDNDKGNGNA